MFASPIFVRLYTRVRNKKKARFRASNRAYRESNGIEWFPFDNHLSCITITRGVQGDLTLFQNPQAKKSYSRTLVLLFAIQFMTVP